MRNKDTLENYFSGESIVSSLTIKIIQDIWAVLGSDLKLKLSESGDKFTQDKYFRVNQLISDALRKHITMFGAKFSIHKHDLPNISNVDMEKMALDNITKRIASEIMESNNVVFRKTENDWLPEIHYTVDIPFLKPALFKDVEK